MGNRKRWPLDFEARRRLTSRWLGSAIVSAGLLAIQELVLRLGRATRRVRRFELRSSSTDQSRWTDVGLIDDQARCLLQIECVNTVGNIGAAVRSSDRKRAEAEALAIAAGGEDPYTVHTCWVVRATEHNRRLIEKYPQLFAARFPGSSRAWVAALTNGRRPPDESGLVWCDVRATRVIEWRKDATQ
jgi:hypothetical protein